MAEGENDELVSYELGYILLPTIAEEEVAGTVTSIKDALERAGAMGFVDGFPTKRPLAYEMQHGEAGKRVRVSQGYFGWVRFQCASAQTDAIVRELKKDERIVRFLFIEAPKEVVALPPKPLRSSLLLRRPTIDRTVPETAESILGTVPATPPKPTMTDEELDRTIEELIVE